MLGLSQGTSFFLIMSNFFWMISVPSMILLSRRTTAFTSLKLPHRGLRLGVRPPPISRASENNFLIARKLKLSEETDPGEVKGTKLRILKYPHPKLRAVNEEVTVFDESLAQTAKEMLLIMYAAEGVGLAAPQVGVNKKLMVFNEKGEQEDAAFEMILVNPVVTAKSEETDLEEEGCLSFPLILGKVYRHKWITIEYQTITGEKKSLKLEGWPARLFQHEFDHLDKVLFIDRLIEKDKKVNQKRLEKYVRKYGAGGAE